MALHPTELSSQVYPLNLQQIPKTDLVTLEISDTKLIGRGIFILTFAG